MARADFKFSLHHRTRYAEIDSQSIVFFGNYLTYFDNALTDYVREMGFDPMTHPQETGADFHVVKVELDYRAPVRLDEEIEICARVERIGRSSLVHRVEVHPKGRDEFRVGGQITWVYTDQTTHKSTPVPADLIAAFEAYEGRKVTAE